MRKILLVLALLMMAFTAKSQKFSAVCESGQTLYYNIIDEENHYVEVAQQKSMTGSIIIPSNVTYNGIQYTVIGIRKAAFYCHQKLTSVTIPNSVKYIGESAFYFCNDMTSIIIPDSVERIGLWAFYGSGIKDFYLPASVISIGHKIGLFEHIVVSPDNTVYDSRYDCNAIISSNGDTLLLGTPNTVIPNGIKAIGASAFMDCKSLTDIIIPNSVKHIGHNAFDGSGLVSVTIPESVEIVEPGAFYNCQNLTSLTIENPMTKMHNGDMGAIASCSNVTISLATTPLKLEKGTFEIVTKKWEYPYEDQEGVEILVYYIWVPSGMAKVYNATDWSKVFIIKDE